jgi:hypothetical protein
MKENSTVAKSQCAGGMILKQVRNTTSRDNAVTNVGHQQNGDSRHQRRHRLVDGHSTNNNRVTTSIMIISFASWRCVGRTASVLHDLLHCYDVRFSRPFLSLL